MELLIGRAAKEIISANQKYLTQIWKVTRHWYGILRARLSDSFRGETSDGVVAVFSGSFPLYFFDRARVGCGLEQSPLANTPQLDFLTCAIRFASFFLFTPVLFIFVAHFKSTRVSIMVY